MPNNKKINNSKLWHCYDVVAAESQSLSNLSLTFRSDGLKIKNLFNMLIFKFIEVLVVSGQ
jgi:hypothetical protein